MNSLVHVRVSPRRNPGGRYPQQSVYVEQSPGNRPGGPRYHRGRQLIIHSQTLDNRHVEGDVRVETMALRAGQWTQFTPRLGNDRLDPIHNGRTAEKPLEFVAEVRPD